MPNGRKTMKTMNKIIAILVMFMYSIFMGMFLIGEIFKGSKHD